MEAAGATLVRPGSARVSANFDGRAGPLQLRAVQGPQVRPGQVRPGGPASRGLSLLREAQHTLGRPGERAGFDSFAALPSDDGG
eukprot:35878-Amphidinium_carterae.1